MFQRALRLDRVEVEEYPNAARQTARHRDFGGAKQRYIGPAQPARSASRVFGGQIGRRCEDRALHIFGRETVGIAKRGEQLLGRFENCLTRICGRGRCAAEPAQDFGHGAR